MQRLNPGLSLGRTSGYFGGRHTIRTVETQNNPLAVTLRILNYPKFAKISLIYYKDKRKILNLLSTVVMNIEDGNYK